MAIVWGNTITGSKSTRKGCIGMTVAEKSRTDTTFTVEVNVYFASMYSLDDVNNQYYYDHNATTATTLKGKVTIKHTVDSGDGWDSANQTVLGTYTHTFNRSTSAQTKYFAAKITNIENLGLSNVSSVYTSIEVPAYSYYTITYNANGGSGAPASQTKNRGVSITLSNTHPTRTGHTFNGWNTKADGSGTWINPGSTYNTDANLTLYAQWIIKKYTVYYNANGGSGAPASETKSHGGTLTISIAEPTRSGYAFMGWGTSASTTTVAYSPGDSYTANANITLYAIWDSLYDLPTITNFKVRRWTTNDTSGSESSSGKHLRISFAWWSYTADPTIVVSWKKSSDTSYSIYPISVTGTYGGVDIIVGDNTIDTTLSYVVIAQVTDGTGGTTKATTTVTSSTMPIDVLRGGTGIAFGKPAETENLMDVGYDTKFNKNVYVGSKNILNMAFPNNGDYESLDFDHALYGFYCGSGEPSYFGATNYPVNETGTLITFRPSSLSSTYTALAQIYITYTGKIYTRARYNSSTYAWTSWDSAYLGGNFILSHDKSIYGTTSSGSTKLAFEASNASGNLTIGWGNYENKSGSTNLYGHDIVHSISNVATPTGYRPYYRRGDTIGVEVQTTGYVTNAGKEVHYTIPLAKPIIGSPTVTHSSVNGYCIRQWNNYVFGSSATSYVSPNTAVVYPGSGGTSLRVVATFGDTTGVTNNAPVGVHWHGNIVLS